MAKKFGATLTNAQIALARKIEAAGLTTYSQAVKAFERRESDRIEEWKKQLAEKDGNIGLDEENKIH